MFEPVNLREPLAVRLKLVRLPFSSKSKAELVVGVDSGDVYRPSCAARLHRNRHEIGRVAAYAGHVPAIQYTPAQHCCPCRLDCSIKNVFELGHYTGFLIRSFEPTRAR